MRRPCVLFLVGGIALCAAMLALDLVWAARIRVPADKPTIRAGGGAAMSSDIVFAAEGDLTVSQGQDTDSGGDLTVTRSQNVIDLARQCDCPNQGDVAPLAGPGDDIINVLDVVALNDRVFRSGPATFQDPNCPRNRGDVAPEEAGVSCGDGIVNVLDVILLTDIAFCGVPAACNPCAPTPSRLSPGTGREGKETAVDITEGIGMSSIGDLPSRNPGARDIRVATAKVQPDHNELTIESKPVSQNDTADVGIFLANNRPLQAFVLPLVVRSVMGGAFWSSFDKPASVASFSLRGGVNPTATRDINTGLIDYVSPDMLLVYYMSEILPCLGTDIPVGTDVTPSVELRMKVNANPGQFELDTLLFPPANTLLFVTGDTDPIPGIGVSPAFRKGTITVIDVDGPATISAVPMTSNAPLTVFFSGIAPDPADSWSWSFGDGGTSVLQNPVHTYTGLGTYYVTAIATVGGSSYFADLTVLVGIRADFVGVPRAGEDPLTVDFTDLTTGAPTTWSWTFGDNGVSDLQNPSHIYTTPGDYTVSLTAANPATSGSLTRLDYIRVADVATPDLEVTLYGAPQSRRGFDKGYYTVLRNVGAMDAASVTLTFVYPPEADFVTSTPAPASMIGNQLTWATPVLDPFTTQTYEVWVNVPISVPLGTILTATATADAAPGEVVLVNNTDSAQDSVVGSIDPNDKLVQPAGCGPGNNWIQGTTPQTYTIQFENKPSATADAIYVLVVDTLDSDLDWSTLQLGPSSKDDVLSTIFDPATGEMMWFFDGINLPPNVTPPEGEGYVAYTISPKPGLLDGTIISNRAFIRFDFEPWLAAPEAGPLILAVMPCSGCFCENQGDVAPLAGPGDGVVNVLDVVAMIDEVFRSGPTTAQDGLCPHPRGDLAPASAGVECGDNVKNVLDVVYAIDHVFRSGPPPCDPCNP